MFPVSTMIREAAVAIVRQNLGVVSKDLLCVSLTYFQMHTNFAR